MRGALLGIRERAEIEVSASCLGASLLSEERELAIVDRRAAARDAEPPAPIADHEADE